MKARVVAPLSALLLAGCASIEVSVPVSGGPRLAADSEACGAALDAVRPRAERNRRYAACMIARGHTAYVNSYAAHFNVRATSSRA